jgi:hypothetical protein
MGVSSSIKQDEARAEELLLDALGRDPNNSEAHYWASCGMRRIDWAHIIQKWKPL